MVSFGPAAACSLPVVGHLFWALEVIEAPGSTVIIHLVSQRFLDLRGIGAVASLRAVAPIGAIDFESLTVGERRLVRVRVLHRNAKVSLAKLLLPCNRELLLRVVLAATPSVPALPGCVVGVGDLAGLVEIVEAKGTTVAEHFIRQSPSHVGRVALVTTTCFLASVLLVGRQGLAVSQAHRVCQAWRNRHARVLLGTYELLLGDRLLHLILVLLKAKA